LKIQDGNIVDFKLTEFPTSNELWNIEFIDINEDIVRFKNKEGILDK